MQHMIITDAQAQQLYNLLSLMQENAVDEFVYVRANQLLAEIEAATDKANLEADNEDKD